MFADAELLAVAENLARLKLPPVLHLHAFNLRSAT
jgi:hypothetical protein